MGRWVWRANIGLALMLAPSVGLAAAVVVPSSTPGIASEPSSTDTEATTQAPPPMPEALGSYFTQALAAEKLEDPVARCQAYPDLPGNAWPEGAGHGRCILQRPAALSLQDIERILEGNGGAAVLDGRMRALLRAHYDEPAERDRIFSVYQEFDESVRSGVVARRWLRAAPDSAFARTALGMHRAAQGWDARGTAYMAGTSVAQVQRMGQHFAAAVPLLDQALAAEPDLSPACIALAAIGRQSSNALQTVALAHCLERDPLSYHVVHEMLVAAKPRWGGSPQAMRAVERYLREQGLRNPTLYAWLGELMLDGRKDGGKVWETLKADYMEMARQAPDARLLEYAGRGQDGLGAWQAVMYLSQSLRFRPQVEGVRAQRAQWWEYLQQWEWAGIDLAWLVALHPDDPGLRARLGWALLQQQQYGAARVQLRMVLERPDAPEHVQVWLCGLEISDPDVADGREMRDCTAALVTRFPDEGMFWMWRMTAALRTADRDALAEAVERHRALIDLSNPELARIQQEFETALREWQP